MMCNSIFTSPLDLSSVGPVVPVVLHRILVRAGGTARGPVGLAQAMLPTRIANLSWWS